MSTSPESGRSSPATSAPDTSSRSSFHGDWTARAACRNGDPDVLFVQGAAQNRAKMICRGCPVRTECLSSALDNKEEFGVWGGMTERERRALLRRRPDVTSWRDILESAKEEYERAEVIEGLAPDEDAQQENSRGVDAIVSFDGKTRPTESLAAATRRYLSTTTRNDYIPTLGEEFTYDRDLLGGIGMDSEKGDPYSALEKIPTESPPAHSQKREAPASLNSMYKQPSFKRSEKKPDAVELAREAALLEEAAPDILDQLGGTWEYVRDVINGGKSPTEKQWVNLWAAGDIPDDLTPSTLRELFGDWNEVRDGLNNLTSNPDELLPEFLPEKVIKQKVPRKRVEKPAEEPPVEEDEVMKLLRASLADFDGATEEDASINAPTKDSTTLNDTIPQIRLVSQSVFISTPELHTRPLDESLINLLTATNEALTYISDQMHWEPDTPEFAYLCATLFAHSELYGPDKKENGELVADYHSYRKQHEGVKQLNTILQLMPYLDVEDPLLVEILDTLQQEKPNYMNLRQKTTAYLSAHGGWSSLLQEKIESANKPSANVLISFVQKPDEKNSLEISEHFWFQEEQDTRTAREVIIDAAKVGLGGETYPGWDSIQSSDALRIALEYVAPNIVSFVNKTGWKASRPQFIFMCASLVTHTVGASLSLEAQKEQLANRLNRYRQNHPDEIKSKLTLALQVAPHLTEEDVVKKHLLSFLKTGEQYLTLQSEMIAFLRENGGLAGLSRQMVLE